MLSMKNTTINLVRLYFKQHLCQYVYQQIIDICINMLYTVVIQKGWREITVNNSDLRVKKTQKVLKEAMRELIYQKPLEKISVIDICSLAMVNRATFYSHYEDKYSLFYATVEEFLEPLELAEPKIVDPRCADLDEYRKYYIGVVAKTIFDHAENNKKLCRSLFKRNDYFEVYLRNYVAKKLHSQLNHLEALGIKLPVKTDAMAAYYSGAASSLMHWWINSDFSVSAEELCGYLDTLLNPKG